MSVTIVGNNTPTAGAVAYGDGTNIAFTSAGTSGQVLTSAGAGVPSFSAIPATNLATGVTGTLGTTNGGTGLTSVGTNGQVLQSNGTSLTWATPATGALIFLSTTTASGVASVNIETGFSATYDNYVIIGNNIIPNTNATYLYAQIKQGGTYLTSNYVYNLQYGDTAVATEYYEVATTVPFSSGVKTAYYITNTATDSGSYYTLTLNINGANTSQVQVIDGKVVGSSSPDRGRFNYFTGMVNGSTPGTLTGIKILVGSGTFTGTFKLYGIS